MASYPVVTVSGKNTTFDFYLFFSLLCLVFFFFFFGQSFVSLVFYNCFFLVENFSEF